MIRLGYVSAIKAKTEKECEQCKETIRAKKWYIMSTGKYRGMFFNHRYHLECYPQYMLDRMKEREANPKSNKHKTNRLDNLTEEQIARRKTLQVYLVGKDLNRLLKAYKNHNTSKVCNAYRIIASRWAELSQMGVPFRQSIVANDNTPMQKELLDLIWEYDRTWVNYFAGAKTLEAKMLLLMREDGGPRFGPIWQEPEKDTELIVDTPDAPLVESTMEGGHHGQDTQDGQHELDVPLDEGLPNVQRGPITLQEIVAENSKVALEIFQLWDKLDEQRLNRHKAN